MKNLFVRHLHLWPRFHSTVGAVLTASQPEVIELHLEMTSQMQDVQTAVLELITFTLKEIKRLNPHLDTEELTVENCVSKSFHKTLQRELNPIWHQLSGKTKQLVSDLKTLRMVLTYLTQYDAVTFYNFISTLKTTESAIKSGGWVLLDSAESLFLTSQVRVFSSLNVDGVSNNKKAKTNSSKKEGFEENPKWTEIGKILDEIRAEIKSAGLEESIPSEKVLIVTRDERTARQVGDYLSIGSQKLVTRMYNKCLGEKYGYLPDSGGDEPTVRPAREIKHKGQGKKSGQRTLNEIMK